MRVVLVGGRTWSPYYLDRAQERPWTSLSCAVKRATSTGTDTANAAADSLARNNPLGADEAGQQHRCSLR